MTDTDGWASLLTRPLLLTCRKRKEPMTDQEQCEARNREAGGRCTRKPVTTTNGYEVCARHLGWAQDQPEAHTQVTVPVLPKCDIHADRTAAYDAKTTSGPWGYLCSDCFAEHGIGLGLGLGQRLVVAP